MPLDIHSFREGLYSYRLKVKIIKALFVFAIILFLIWHYALKEFLYQRVYGVRDNQVLTIYDADKMIDLPKQPVQRANVNGFDIEVELVKKFETVTRVIYVDRYSALGTWYRSRDGADLYDKIVPLDVSTATGYLGRHPECFDDIDHEYRCLLWLTNPRCSRAGEDIDVNNNHIIPATKNVQRGLDILKAGDIARMEGYLVYWQGTGKYSWYRFESAVTLGQVSEQRYGGSKSGLCRQIYLTKLSFNGFTFE